MHVWVVTETDRADRSYVLRVVSTMDSGKRVAELDFHESVDGAMNWQDDLIPNATFARCEHSMHGVDTYTTYSVTRMEVME